MSKNLYLGKYRRESRRAQWWDYTNNAAYFVTIVIKNRVHFFGDVQNEKMVLSAIGQIANDIWYEMPAHQPYVKLDAFVVMPDHIHCIVGIDKPVGIDAVTDSIEACLDAADTDINTKPKNQKMAAISPKSGSLATIIGGYKSAITKNARKINANFNWQPRFHDRIIRNDAELNRIRKYIDDNPKKWGG